MSLDYAVRYPANTVPADSNYPQGSAKNSTIPGAKNGFPFEKDYINDILGFFQALLLESGISPSGSPETALVSDLLDSLNQIKTTPITTVALMKANIRAKAGMIYRCAERDNGYFLVITGVGTANTWNIIEHDILSLSFLLINDRNVDLKKWGAGLGITDDRPIFQSAIAQGFINFLNGDGTYIIGASGNTIPYRATTTNTGVELASNVSMMFSGHNSIIKVKDASDCVPFTANGLSNVSFGNFRIEGNALNQTAALLFGIYCLNCDGVNQEGTLWINETKDNTIESIGCTNITHNNTINYTSSAGGSEGGGPQFEDCSTTVLGKTSGVTFDDLVSVIAMAADVRDLSLGQINGSSENSRALFIGQSGTAASQRTIENITASVNSRDAGAIGLTGSFVINNGGIYKNLNISLVDRESFQAARITPFDATFHGRLESCKFKIICNKPDAFAIDIRHDDHVDTVYKNNKLDVVCVGANNADLSTNEAVKIQGGDGWDVNVNLEYPSGKTNKQAAVTLGLTGSSNAKVTNSKIAGFINGGDTNIRLNSTDNVLLDSLMTISSENTNNTNIDITVGATNTRLGTIVRDGEINDDSVAASQTKKDVVQLYRDSATKDTGAVTTEVDLMSYNLPAAWMGKTGVLHIKASGVIGGASGNKTLTFIIVNGGDHDGSSGAAVMDDSSKAWTTNALIGLTIKNITDGSTATITANTPTTVTGILSGGTDNDWDNGDVYSIDFPHVLHAAANDSGDWSTDIYIHQQGLRNSQRLDINHLYDTVIAINDGISDGVDTTDAVIIKFTGQTDNSGDSISQRTMVINGA